RRRAPVSTTMRCVTWRSVTSDALIHAVAMLGRMETCTLSQSPWRPCSRNTTGRPSHVGLSITSSGLEPPGALYRPTWDPMASATVAGRLAGWATPTRRWRPSPRSTSTEVGASVDGGAEASSDGAVAGAGAGAGAGRVMGAELVVGPLVVSETSPPRGQLTATKTLTPITAVAAAASPFFRPDTS